MRPKLEGKCLSKITLFSHGSSVMTECMTPAVQENKSKTCANPKMIRPVLEKHLFLLTELMFGERNAVIVSRATKFSPPPWSDSL